MALRWYIVHAYSNFEHKVKSSLEERIKLMGLEDKFGEILVPTEEVVEMKEGQKRRSERKFFPGYVLVQMEMDDETWHLVKEVPKVLGFIGGSSDKPAPITEKEADQILKMADSIGVQSNQIVLTQQQQNINIAATQAALLSAQQLMIGLIATYGL